MAGHLIRLTCNLSVSLYGFVLHIVGGPEWLAASLMALGLILLLIWRPGDVPVEQNRPIKQ